MLQEKGTSVIEKYESIMETLEILADEEQMVALRQGAQEALEGQGKPWKTVKKELGWDDTETPVSKKKHKK